MTAIKPNIREALRRAQITAKDLTHDQRARAEAVSSGDPDLTGKAAVEFIMTEPEAKPSAAAPEPSGRDPEAADLAARAKLYAGTKSRFWTNEARRFLDEFHVDLGDPTRITVQRDGRNAVIPRELVVGYALGELGRADRKPVAAALAQVNVAQDGTVAVHWDRALAAMIAVLFVEEPTG